jgi:hypothetical protein
VPGSSLELRLRCIVRLRHQRTERQNSSEQSQSWLIKGDASPAVCMRACSAVHRQWRTGQQATSPKGCKSRPVWRHRACHDASLAEAADAGRAAIPFRGCLCSPVYTGTCALVRGLVRFSCRFFVIPGDDSVCRGTIHYRITATLHPTVGPNGGCMPRLKLPVMPMHVVLNSDLETLHCYKLASQLVLRGVALRRPAFAVGKLCPYLEASPGGLALR